MVTRQVSSGVIGMGRHMRAPIFMTANYYPLRLGVTILGISIWTNSTGVETYGSKVQLDRNLITEVRSILSKI